jgi:hypothetical protein
MKRPLLLLCLMLSLSSCRYSSLFYVEPAGPREYQLGWQDGCDTGISAQDTFLYKIMYGFRKRPEFGSSDLYKTGWNEGYNYCRTSAEAQGKGWDAPK